MPGRLIFTAEGVWVHEDTPVTNRKIALYFSRHLRFSPEHNSYVVEVDGRCVSVDIEDTPLVVRTILLENNLPHELLLSDESSEAFNQKQLKVGSNQALYCLLSDGRLARLMRPAVQAIMPHVEEKNGEFFVCLGPKQTLIERIERDV